MHMWPGPHKESPEFPSHLSKWVQYYVQRESQVLSKVFRKVKTNPVKTKKMTPSCTIEQTSAVLCRLSNNILQFLQVLRMLFKFYYSRFLFSGFWRRRRLLSPKVVIVPAHPHRKAQQLPRGEAGSGGVPRRQADAFQGLPESRTGCLGEEAYRAGPVFCHHLSQRSNSDRLQL